MNKSLASTAERFVCVVCTQSQSARGFCPEHADEPLLDTCDARVIAFLTSLDEKALRTRLTRLVFAVALLIAFGMLLAYFALAYGISLNTSSKQRLSPMDDMELVMEILVFVGITGTGMVLAIARRRMINGHQFIFDPWTNANRLRPTEQEFSEAEAWRFDSNGDNEQ